MLVLSRKEGEAINIGDQIVVKVTKIERGRVRIGIEAPKQVPVVRAELHTLKGADERANEDQTEAAGQPDRRQARGG